MTDATGGRPALEVTVTAPVVSFRNPLNRAAALTLPCPPPSTVGGMLAAAAGGWDRVDPALTFALAFHARGRGTDLETYRPVGRKGAHADPTPRDREFLAETVLRIWLFEDLDRWRSRLRRPRWPLRLGRSQDLVGITVGQPATISGTPGIQRAALVPEGTPGATGTALYVPGAVAPGMAATRFEMYLFDSSGTSEAVLPGSWSAADGQAVVPLSSPHPLTIPGRRPAWFPSTTATEDLLKRVLAKSATKERDAEELTAHLGLTRAAAVRVQQRVGRIAVAEACTGSAFWPAVAWAALTHDAGKIANGMQRMLHQRSRSWGERHEVLSLGFLPHLINDPDLLAWVAAGVATHHQALMGPDHRNLEVAYRDADPGELHDRFGPLPKPTVTALLHWLHATAVCFGLPQRRPLLPLTTERLIDAAQEQLDGLFERWIPTHGSKPTPAEGLTAVLLQGAVTLADHLSSAHQQLNPRQPVDATLPHGITDDLARHGAPLRLHQHQAAATSGHLLLRAPTGSGKTEAALLWAATQTGQLAAATGGVPRVFYTLPYLASINAMTRRLGKLIGDQDAVGVAHSRAASYHLARAITPDDDTAPADDGGPCRAEAASKAVSRAAATKLFRETLRVGTPYQLLRAALAGPAHSGILLDSANSVFILDELHAYDEQRLGYLLATARLWQDLGGRIAVLSATLPERLVDLFNATLDQHTKPLSPDLGLPYRHRLTTRSHHLTDPDALAEIKERIDRDESVLVVANNVRHAHTLYEALAPAARLRHGTDGALLLHSRYKRGDRDAIERHLSARYATRGPRQPGLLVATQVVEVSLDVDFDVLFTAAAPLEALLQRFGRINRVAARPAADVIVHAPAWTTRADTNSQYADGIYPRHPVEAAWDKLTTRAGTTIDEGDATDWLNTIYNSRWGDRWADRVTEHRDAFTRAFLTFTSPYDDRTHLAATFDTMFNGTEGVLAEELSAYRNALAEAPGAAGRLLADEFLIPLPPTTGQPTADEKRLKLRIIDGDYTKELGLTAIRSHRAEHDTP